MAGKQLSQADRCVVGEGGENAVDDQTGEQIKEDFRNAPAQGCRKDLIDQRQFPRLKIGQFWNRQDSHRHKQAQKEQVGNPEPGRGYHGFGKNQHPGLYREGVHQISFVRIQVFVKPDRQIDG